MKSPMAEANQDAIAVVQQERMGGTSLVAQWLRLRTLNAGGLGSIPGQGTRSHMRAATKSVHATTKEPREPQLRGTRLLQVRPGATK